MKVILKQDVKGLGKAESLVNASDGYARNYLLPRGMAVEATPAHLNEMKAKKDAVDKKDERELEAAKQMALKLKQVKLVMKAKTGESGKLFGSITGKDISDKLMEDFKLNVDKKKINLEEPLKSTGQFEIEMKLCAGVTARLDVTVEAE